MTVNEKLQVVVAVLLGVFGIVILAGVCIGVLEGTSKIFPGHGSVTHDPVWDSADCLWHSAL